MRNIDRLLAKAKDTKGCTEITVAFIEQDPITKKYIAMYHLWDGVLHSEVDGVKTEHDTLEAVQAEGRL